ncbi:hypothetical protein Lal_00031768 [Lupinus albus]|nr:hypothetical protein Lal_00031768 [Lupinus albus]
MDVGLRKNDVCKTKNNHGSDFKRNTPLKDLIIYYYGSKESNSTYSDTPLEKSGNLAQARNWSLVREKPGQAVRFSLERENLAQARGSVFCNIKYRGLLAQASDSRPDETTQL